jgi:cytochrome c oxidase cbb3-type subunit 2
MNWQAMRAALAVAGIYGYFLIFAQFSFVELLRGAGIGVGPEKAVLGAMAAAGIAGGFLVAWRGVSPRAIRIALIIAGFAAALAPLVSGMGAFVVIALATGLCLGAATVGLSALLPAWCGVAWVGLGTGLGYAVCNVPAVFLQTPAGQAWIGAVLVLAALLALPAKAEWKVAADTGQFPFWCMVILFTALVWLDSAAFFIIQHAQDLKSGTWSAPLLWRNAALHLGFALLSGLWLKRGPVRDVPVVAWLMLAVAALWVNDATTRWAAAWLYPSAVSLYSVALVVWPGWFSGASDSRSAAWKAAWLFAIAGWIGSANGIGMAETLLHVPTIFIVISAVVVLVSLCMGSRTRSLRPALAVGAVVLCGWIMAKPADAPRGSAAERGRQVYVAEGCIHCHSQYSRPGSGDEAIWGPAPTTEKTLERQPVLIGNRRHGPDLTNIGARRSEAWLKAHFMNPRALAPDSTMPSYAHLFQDGRGDDLVRYLRESGIDTMQELMARQAAWLPGKSPSMRADGRRLFARHCAVCHGSDGAGGGPLADQFPMSPTNLRDGPFIRTPDGQVEAIARIIKFGVIGSHMPGHETLRDAEIRALSVFVSGIRQ